MRICLPRAEAAPVLRHKTDQPIDVAANIGATVLVVEGDPDVRRLVVLLLAQLGCDTIEADDGETALERLRGHPEIDALFINVILPGGISGADLANEAYGLYPNLKMILTSGYPDGEFGDVIAKTAIEILSANRIARMNWRRRSYNFLESV